MRVAWPQTSAPALGVGHKAELPFFRAVWREFGVAADATGRCRNRSPSTYVPSAIRVVLLNRFFTGLRLVLARLTARRTSAPTAPATEPTAEILIRQIELLSHHFIELCLLIRREHV